MDKMQSFHSIFSEKYHFVEKALYTVIEKQSSKETLKQFNLLAHFAHKYRKTSQKTYLNRLNSAIEQLSSSKRSLMIKAFAVFFYLNNLLEDCIRVDINNHRRKTSSQIHAIETVIELAKKRMSL